MSNYKKYFSKTNQKLKIAGAGSKAEPSNLIPNKRAFVKESYSLSSTVDLVSEGPIGGLVDVDGRYLAGDENDIIETVPSEDNVLSSKEGFILKGFPDKFLNQTYLPKVSNIPGSYKKLRSKKSYRTIIIVDLSSNSERHLDAIKEKVQTVIESTNLMKAAGYQIDFTLVGLGDQGQVIRQELVGFGHYTSLIPVFGSFQYLDDISRTTNPEKIYNSISNATTLVEGDGKSRTSYTEAIANILDEQGDRGYYPNAFIVIGANPDTTTNKSVALERIEELAQTAAVKNATNRGIVNVSDPTQGNTILTFGFRLHVLTIDIGNGEMERSLRAVKNASLNIETKEFQSDKTVLDVFKYIQPNLLGTSSSKVYRGFEGAKNQLHPKDVPQLAFDGSNWAITNLEGSVIYYTCPEDRFSYNLFYGFDIPWTASEQAAGPAGETYLLNGLTLDKGVYFDELQLKTDRGKQFAKYKIEQKLGSENQTASKIVPKAVRLHTKNFKLLGPYDRDINGARAGTGSADIRKFNSDTAGGSRNFTDWQSFDPAQTDPSIFYHEVTDEDVDSLDLEIQISQLSDTQSFSSKGDNKSGRATMGRNLATTIKYSITLELVFRDGTTENRLLNLKIPLSDKKGFQTVNTESASIISVKGIITAPYSFTIKDIVLPEKTDDIVKRVLKVEKLTYETNSNLINRLTHISSVAERSKYSFNYPYSASIVTSLDARAFDDMPNRTFKLKGKKILIPSNYFPTDEAGLDRRFSEDSSTAGNLIYDGLWDGTFRYDWSDNPAWILFDLLNNFRYGTALYNRDLENIDIWSLYEIGRYCDAVDDYGKFEGLTDGFGGLEPRFSYNHKIDGDNEAFTIIKDIAKFMRCLVYYKDSQVQFKIDKPEQASMLFNNLNVVDGLFNYADVVKNSRTSSVDVSFLDKKNNYRPRTEYAEDRDAIERYGYLKQYIDGFGHTSRASAQRSARNIIFDSTHATETVSFAAGFEAALLAPGDIIKIDDEMKSLEKNYGMFLTQTGANSETHKYPNGAYGPTGLIVDHQIGSQTGLIPTGENNESYIYLYNASNSTSLRELYAKKDNARVTYTDEEISGLKKPKISKLQIDTGAHPFQNLGDDSILIKLNPNQNFPQDAGYFPSMTPYSVDITGRAEKQYRVLSVKENEDSTYAVGAIIYHSGKYDVIEKNVNFDPTQDNFDVSLQSNVSTLPQIPASITARTDLSGVNKFGAIDHFFDIVNSDPVQADQYKIFLTYPSNRSIVLPRLLRTGLGTNEGNTSDNGKTQLAITGELINQFGTYELEIFSEFTKYYTKRSTNSRSVEFTVTADDLGLGNFGKVVTFDGITSKNQDDVFTENFAKQLTGTSLVGESDSQGSRLTRNDNDDSFLDLSLQYVDFVGNNALDQGYNLASEFHFYDSNPGSGMFNAVELAFTGKIGMDKFVVNKSNNHESLQVSVTGLKSGFDFEEANSTCLNNKFGIQTSGFSGARGADRYGTGYHVKFAEQFKGSPVVFIQQVMKSGISFTDYNNLDTYNITPSVVRANTTGFIHNTMSNDVSFFNYFAFETGDFRINNQRFKVRRVEKSDYADLQVDFADSFTGQRNENVVNKKNPIVFVQKQANQNEISFVGGTIAQVLNGTNSGFSLRATNIYGCSDTGDYGYLAIEQTNDNVNEFNFQVIDDDKTQFTGGDIFLTDGLLSPYNSGIENINYTDFGSGTFNYRASHFYQDGSQKISQPGDKFDYYQVDFLAQNDGFVGDTSTHTRFETQAAVVDGGNKTSGNWVRYSDVGAYNNTGIFATGLDAEGDNVKIHFNQNTLHSSGNLNIGKKGFSVLGWFQFKEDSDQWATLIDNWHGTGFVWRQSGGYNQIFAGTGNSQSNVVNVAENLNDGKTHSIFVSVGNNGAVTSWVDGERTTGTSVDPWSETPSGLNNLGVCSFLGSQGNGGNAGCPLTGQSLSSGFAQNFMFIKDGIMDDNSAKLYSVNPYKAYIATDNWAILDFHFGTGALATDKGGLNVVPTYGYSISGGITGNVIKTLPINDGNTVNQNINYTTGVRDYNVFMIGGVSGDVNFSTNHNGISGNKYTEDLILNMSPFRDGIGFDAFVSDIDNFADFESGEHREEIIIPEGKISGVPLYSGFNAGLEFGEEFENESVVTIDFQHSNPLIYRYPTGIIFTGFSHYTGVDSNGNFIDGETGWYLTNSGGNVDDPTDYGNVAITTLGETTATTSSTTMEGFFSGHQNIVSVKFFTGSQSGFTFNPYSDDFAFERDVNLRIETGFSGGNGGLGIYQREFIFTNNDIDSNTGMIFYSAIPYSQLGPILNMQTGQLASHKNLNNPFGSFRLDEHVFSGRMFTGFPDFNDDHPNVEPTNSKTSALVSQGNLKLTGECHIYISRESGLSDLQFNDETFVVSHTAGEVEFRIDTGIADGIGMDDEWSMTIDQRTSSSVRVRDAQNNSTVATAATSAGAVSKNNSNEAMITVTYDKTSNKILFREFSS